MNGAFCTVTGRQHVPLTASAAFVDDAGKDGSLGKRRFSPTFFAFEGFEKGSNDFPELIRNFAEIELFHGEYPFGNVFITTANFIPDIL